VFSGKQEVYLEIAERYESLIVKGIYNKGDKLPSVREAASEMGVNPNTVARAYALLEERGFVRALPKKGAFVIYDGEQKTNDSNAETMLLCRASLMTLKQFGARLDDIIEMAKEVFEDDKN
jgi:GntR family transcriptional regulator